MFVTAACVVIDPRDGSAAAAIAGHPPPLWWDGARGRLVPLRGRSMPLGLQPGWSGSTGQWRLAPGDALLLYTDGVTDAKINDQERLGEERLAELLGGTAPLDVADWVERLRGALASGTEWPDDVTIVAIGREPFPTAALASPSRPLALAPLGPRLLPDPADDVAW